MYDQNNETSRWNQDSVLIKLGVIIAITLLLLIPSAWIQGLITDREGYQKQMVNNIANRWAGDQLIQGPILAIPYKGSIASTGKSARQQPGVLYVLPQNLVIKADTKTQKLKKSIYEAVIYDATISIHGNFSAPNPTAASIDPATMEYDKAWLEFSVSDLKGLKNNPDVTIDGHRYSSSIAADGSILPGAMLVSFPMQKDTGFDFSYNISLKGSNHLNFLPIGKTTDVTIGSDWRYPDSDSTALPDHQLVNDHGFTAKWHLSSVNRPFPQQWTNDASLFGDNKLVKANAVGVSLHLPVGQYREVLRTAKYAILIILLTFVSLFLTEMIKKVHIHLFNYTLISAAMVVYYTLLLSFSEQIGFDYAYLLASVATIGLISWFTSSLLQNGRIAVLFASILSIFYGFVYIIVQLEDLALLFGSVALFIIVAMLMYFSRKINWDRH